MIRKTWMIFCFSAALLSVNPIVSLTDTTTDAFVATTESCGAYLFKWRPVDYGNSYYFAILVGGDSVTEGDVILDRGYDYAYTFNPSMHPRQWGEVFTSINVDGVWVISENQPLLPEGTQSALQIVLYTNNGRLPDKERHAGVVRPPSNVDTSTPPADVRKYLISVDGSDTGAYEGTKSSGRAIEADGRYRYRRPDGTFVSGEWLNVDDNLHCMDEERYMLSDMITSDGPYVNTSGAEQKYMSGWSQNERGWRYVLKNGYLATSTWVQDTDGKYYYLDIDGYMRADYGTPDGYHVGSGGVWDGAAVTGEYGQDPGPGGVVSSNTESGVAEENTQEEPQTETVEETNNSPEGNAVDNS